MTNTAIKRTSMLTVIVMMITMLSVFAMPVTAKAPVPEDFLADVSLDYASLSEDAYIVNTAWNPSLLQQGNSLSYVFEGSTKTVTYDANKHFMSFGAAYAAYKASVTNMNTLITNTPVFIINGIVTENITVNTNAIILGPNAGTSPNTELDTAAAVNPTEDWAENVRSNEATIKGQMSFVNLAEYDALASDGTTYTVTVDGFTLSPAQESIFVAKDVVENAAQKNLVFRFVNCKITTTDANNLFSTIGSNNVNCYALKNVRITDSTFTSVFDGNTDRMHADGVCFANNKASFVNASFSREYTDLDVRNSYFYENNVAYVINTYYSQTVNHISRINIHNNIFRDAGTGNYGFATFRSNKCSSQSNYMVNMTGNTILQTNGNGITALNGANDIYRGPITLNFNRNRVLGYKSMFPNLGGNSWYDIEADYNYNYFQPTYDSSDTVFTDNTSTERSHYSPELIGTDDPDAFPYVDPMDRKLLIYYTDYNLTVREDALDIVGAGFYDDLELLTVDNDNNTITIVTNNALSTANGFIFSSTPDKIEYYYTYKYMGIITREAAITSIGPAGSNSFDVCYVRATIGDVKRTFEITVVAEDSATVPAFSTDFTCPTGELLSTAYLLVSDTSKTSYTMSLNGSKYTFTVGTNAFGSVSEIFAKKSNPQILVAPGSYAAITLTGDCELYGVNYATPASIGTGAQERYYGASWSTADRSTIASISVSSGTNVKISGVNVTGTVTTKATTTNIRNSVIGGGIAVSGVTNLTVSGSRIASTAAAIKGTLPKTTTVASSYVTSATRLFDTVWNTTSDCSLTITDSRFDGVGVGYMPSPTGTKTHTNSSLIVKDSAFMTSGSANGVISAVPTYCSMSFVGNAFVNSGTSTAKAFATTASFELTGNRFVGFTPGVTTDYNYFADYTEDFIEAANGKALGSVYYLDYALTALSSDVKLNEIYLGYSGAESAAFSNASKTIRIRLGSGNAGDVNFGFTGLLPYSIYLEAACTNPVTLYQATYVAGKTYTYYVLPNYQTKDMAYKLVIECTNGANEFSEIFEDETISKNAYLLVPSASVENGLRFSASWLGNSYDFVQGINAFTSLDDISQTAKDAGIETPQILVPAWSGNLNINNAGKLYTQNYNVMPYTVAGTATDGSDWAYNDAYTANKVTVGNIVIGAGCNGTVELYGFEMTGQYLDRSRTLGNDLDAHIENMLVNGGSLNGVFRCDNDDVRVSDQQAQLTNDDVLYVKNIYVQSTTGGRFLTEYYPQTVTFDGLFLDYETVLTTTICYVKLAGKHPVLTFKNSNLRNLQPTANKWLFEGSHTTIASGYTSKIIWDNNILYNFRTAASNMFVTYTEWLTDFIFTNNKVYHPTETPVNLLEQARTGANIEGTAVVVEKNLLIGINNTFSIGTNPLNTADSSIAGNYTSTADDATPTELTATGGSSATVPCSSYALTKELRPLNTDFVIQKAVGPGEIVIDGFTMTATLMNYANKMTVTFGDPDITAVFYSNATCTTKKTSITSSGTYYLRGEYTGADGTVIKPTEWVYTLVFTKKTNKTNVFTERFVDTDTLTKDAMLITNDVASSAKYDIVTKAWDTTQYSFLVGVNAFATVDEAYAHAQEVGIENPQYMILDLGGTKGTSEYNTFAFTCPGSYFTQNYNKVPYIKGTKADGSDWKSNINTGKTNFNVSKGITIKWMSAKHAPSGTYKFYGFTITNTIEDLPDTADENETRANADVELYFENTYFNKTYGDATALYTKGTRFDENQNNYNDKFTLKNTYYVNASTKSFFGGDTSGQMNMWADTTIDGLYADLTNDGGSFGWMTLYQRAMYSNLVIRNCNIRNKMPDGHITYGALGSTYTGGAIGKEVIIEDNIFYNYSLYSAEYFLHMNLRYTTKLSFERNYVYLPDVSNAEFLYSSTTGNMPAVDFEYTVRDNYLNGIDNSIYTKSRAIADASYIGHNYTLSSFSDTEAVGERLYSSDISDAPYYLDSAMTILSNTVSDMTINDGEEFNTDGGSYITYVAPDEKTVNLNAIIDTGYNSIAAYMDSGFTIPTDADSVEVANAGSRVYIRVISNDGSVTQSRVLNILREDGFTVQAEAVGSSFNKVEDGTTFNWLSWRGRVTATGELTLETDEKLAHRVGMLYFSSKTYIDKAKQLVEQKVAATDFSGVNDAIAAVNTTLASIDSSNSMRAYVMNENKALVWNSAQQCYGYRYNFSVQDGYARGAIMYVIYEGTDGKLAVSFSDASVLLSQ